MALRVRTVEGEEKPVAFGACLFHKLGLAPDVHSHPSVLVEQIAVPPSSTEDEGNELGLQVVLSLAKDGGGVPLGHAENCPAYHATKEGHTVEAAKPSTDALDRDRGRPPRVQIAVVVLIEAHDPDGVKVLVTRRRNDAFIFPSVWVLPGGHAEKGETLLQTGKREAEEETGVKLKDENMQLCGLWESCYPSELCLGPIKKQHLVVFYRAIINKPTSEIKLHLQEELTEEQQEVEGACWIDRAKIRKWVEVEERKMTLFKEVREQRGGTSVRDYFLPEVLAAFKRIEGSEDELRLPAIRFKHDTAHLTEHNYDMREEWLALGHRFILKSLICAAL